LFLHLAIGIEIFAATIRRPERHPQSECSRRSWLYLSAGAVLVQSSLIAILGRKPAMEFRRAHPIEIRELPFEAPVLHSVMSWHRCFDDAPAHRWLPSTIIGTATTL
jgi:hypothetical protein